jgi:hypothetical protein
LIHVLVPGFTIALLQLLLSPDFQRVHLLHGVLHANGFGHLCRVNGREGGASTLTGTHLMHAWDCLCSVLRARHVSVEDVSNKLTLELRVLHAIAYGKTWYGRWIYNFGRGPYNRSAADWAAAVATASGTLLHELLDASGKRRRKTVAVRSVLGRYGSGGAAATLGEALTRVFDYIREPAKAKGLLVATGDGGQRPAVEGGGGFMGKVPETIALGTEAAGDCVRPTKRPYNRKKNGGADGKPVGGTFCNGTVLLC